MSQLLSKLHLSMDEHKKTAKDRFEESCAAKYSPVIKTGRANQFWRVAAVFFALISITALTLVLKPQKDSPLVNNVGQADSADLQSVDKGKEVEHIINDSTSQQKSVDPIHIESVGFNRYAENFIPNATYEALIGAQFRAGGRPEILIPGKDTSLVQGSVLTFKGKNPGQDFLEIQILNNHADTVRTFTKLDSINLEVKLDFDPGLYYWKLLGENELHQVGKFIIKEMDR